MQIDIVADFDPLKAKELADTMTYDEIVLAACKKAARNEATNRYNKEQAEKARKK